ncbi:hypothetical protein PV326_013958 [Microctonus aethiopoides]|nr:hypothetical protein PV326_013958 [Microctonus aethiopoides]
MWKPTNWFGWKSYFYNSYTIVIRFFTCGFTLAHGIDLLFVSRKVSDFTNNISAFLGMVNACLKYAEILRTRKSVIKICQNFQSGLFKPNTLDEIQIQDKYNQLIRILFLGCTTLYNMSGAGITIGRMYGDRIEYELPYRTTLPYDHTEPIIFRFTIVMQFIIVCIGANILAAFDTFFVGMMLQICAKIKILKHRFRVIVSTLEKIQNEGPYDVIEYDKLETKMFSVWIKSHNDILSSDNIIARKTNEFFLKSSLTDDVGSIFSKVIFVQFSVSAFVLCTTIYVISQVPVFTAEFAGNFLYLIATTTQIFMLCISAHQFSDLSRVMYDTNWFVLSTSAQKKIVLMMARTLKPIEFSSGHLASLSLESFKSIMKVTYSTYSLLKTS